MEKCKRILYHIFIEGMSGMALGLFATLIMGTIIQQIGSALGGNVGAMVYQIGKMAAAVTGAGIGVGVAYKFKESPLVLISAGACGMLGGFAAKMLAGTVLAEGGVMVLAGPGEPLGAFVAAMVGISFGHLVSGKTQVDILVTPFVTIMTGAVAGLVVGPPITAFMTWLGSVIQFAMEQQPFLMGILVSVIMGMVLTLPISSAALGLMLGLSGITAGAATVGCCCQMVGFAVASFRENGVGGLLAQGVGTSMLQVPNIFRKPLIWIPPIVTSAILGPVSSVWLHMSSNAIGSGMGTAGFVGQIMSWQTMTQNMPAGLVALEILMMHFLLPAGICFLISELMRKKGWIKQGDMKLDL